MKKSVGCSPGLDASEGYAIAFEGAHDRRAGRDDPAPGAYARVRSRPPSRRRSRRPRRASTCSFDGFRGDRAERAEPDVESEMRTISTPRRSIAASSSGVKCSDAVGAATLPGDSREDGLIALLRFGRLVVNVGRQRHPAGGAPKTLRTERVSRSSTLAHSFGELRDDDGLAQSARSQRDRRVRNRRAGRVSAIQRSAARVVADRLRRVQQAAVRRARRRRGARAAARERRASR